MAHESFPALGIRCTGLREGLIGLLQVTSCDWHLAIPLNFSWFFNSLQKAILSGACTEGMWPLSKMATIRILLSEKYQLTLDTCIVESR